MKSVESKNLIRSEETLPTPKTEGEVKRLTSAAMSDLMRLRARGIIFGNQNISKTDAKTPSSRSRR